MGHETDPASALATLIGEHIVVDVRAPYVYMGTLEAAGPDALVLRHADVHLCDDSQSTTEVYILEASKDGIRANRELVYVMMRDVVSVSRLADIIPY